MVKVAGKKLSWKKPNIPKDKAMRIKTQIGAFSYGASLNSEMTGITVKPITVGMAV